MKTKTIFLTAALLGCFIGSAAQDVTVLHMKDGTTKRYMNGVKWKTSMEFYEHTPAATVTSPSYGSTTHENGYQYDWGVTQVLKLDGDYLVGLFWQDEVPENFQAQHGVCFGTEPGLTVDNCQEKMNYSKGANVTFSSVSDMNRSHYMWIGPRKSGNLRMSIDNYRWLESRDTLNYINIPLEIGQTYYYRTFSEGMINEAGQEKTVVFYGEERSFRVPRVMRDFGYFAYPCATKEALTAFANAHLDSLPAPTWQRLEPLWNKWRATDEGKNFDLSTDITSDQFDDGTGYRLNRIPDEFYTWAANREIVIDAFDGLAEVSKFYDRNLKDSVFVASADSITNVDPKWGVAGGKYIRFVPNIASLNYKITYRSDEVVAGVRYKLQLTFAPETDENADSTYFLPTKVRVYEGKYRIDFSAYDSKSKSAIIPATDTTTIETDNFYTLTMGLNLMFDTNVLNNEIRKGLYNRILRIAEIRLIPMKDE